MVLQSTRYQPYKEEQWQRIKEMWDLYKQNIGLEGDISIEFHKKGYDEFEINRAVETHRNDIKENLEIWYGLRKEAQ